MQLMQMQCRELRNRNLVWKEKLMSGLRRCQRLRHGRPASKTSHRHHAPPGWSSLYFHRQFVHPRAPLKRRVVGWRRIAVPRGSARERVSGRATCRRREPAAASSPSVRQYERRFERGRKGARGSPAPLQSRRQHILRRHRRRCRRHVIAVTLCAAAAVAAQELL